MISNIQIAPGTQVYFNRSIRFVPSYASTPVDVMYEVIHYSPDVYVDLNDGDSPRGWFFTSAMLLPATLPHEPTITFNDLLQGVQ